MPRLALAAATFALAAGAASAASSIVPAQPSAFDPVNLRMRVDSCSFSPATVRVSASGTTLRVVHHPIACLVPGEPRVADVLLGALAPGEYRVEVVPGFDSDVPPSETLRFTVTDRPEIALDPRPPWPLTDYSGLWWTSSESGWGLSLHHAPSHVVFGALFVYGTNGQPEWFTLQGGQWFTSTRWVGTLYRTTGPWFAGAEYDPRVVLVAPAGTATLEFSQVPGEEGRGRFTYTAGGATVTKVITRMPF